MLFLFEGANIFFPEGLRLTLVLDFFLIVRDSSKSQAHLVLKRFWHLKFHLHLTPKRRTGTPSVPLLSKCPPNFWFNIFEPLSSFTSNHENLKVTTPMPPQQQIRPSPPWSRKINASLPGRGWHWGGLPLDFHEPTGGGISSAYPDPSFWRHTT